MMFYVVFNFTSQIPSFGKKVGYRCLPGTINCTDNCSACFYHLFCYPPLPTLALTALSGRLAFTFD